MFARVTTIQIPPELLEEVRPIREQVLRAAQGRPGFRGGYDLVDPATGKAVAVTLWETEEALRASEAAARPTPGGVPHVETFEVVAVYESGGGLDPPGSSG